MTFSLEPIDSPERAEVCTFCLSFYGTALEAWAVFLFRLTRFRRTIWEAATLSAMSDSCCWLLY